MTMSQQAAPRAAKSGALRRPRGLLRAAIAGLLPLLLLGCFAKSPPRVGAPYDAVIVPGCPSAPDGSLSPCQKSRAAWASVLWQRGGTQHFITSGAAVYTPYVEAEALAAALVALGVPSDRVYLDSEALHTDENMYNAARIAGQLGFTHVAVASQGLQARGGCSIVIDRGIRCTPLPLEDAPTGAKLATHAATLSELRSRRLDAWQPLAEVEAARRQQTGRRRLPSYVLYPYLSLRRAFGSDTSPVWIPSPTTPPAPLRWSDLYSDKRR